MSEKQQPDIVIIMTDEERASPPYETDALSRWRQTALPGRSWFDTHAVSFGRHYTGSLACVPSRPTLFTGQYPDVHGVTQTDGLGKTADDGRMRWLRAGEVPTLGHWFRAAGYDTHYDGKWHMSHADLLDENGNPVPTNDAHGRIDPGAVNAYIKTDPLAAFGFSGWVGPEPHGGALGNSGVRRDPLIADRICAWLQDRYARRRAGDPAAQVPFLLVASFVNPHDICLFAPWMARGFPVDQSLQRPPAIPAPPTADEDLAGKPGVQAAYRDAYASAFGPIDATRRAYADHTDTYRELYYRLHAEVDMPIDRVRRAVSSAGSDAVIVRTSDHGDLLGAHGGLHQKWFTLYDEATRVPFQIARTGATTTAPRIIDDMPTSHVDLVPTLLSAAGIDAAVVGAQLAAQFTEVHALPGVDLMPVVDGGPVDKRRSVYAITRDHILEGDTGLSAGGRAFNDPTLLIETLPDVPTNVEGLVARAADGNLWKLVRTFDDPATWSDPFQSQISSAGVRREPLADEFELYNLDSDPIEAINCWRQPEAADVLAELMARLEAERERCVPPRHADWAYARLARTAAAG